MSEVTRGRQATEIRNARKFCWGIGDILIGIGRLTVHLLGPGRIIRLIAIIVPLRHFLCLLQVHLIQFFLQHNIGYPDLRQEMGMGPLLQRR